MKKLIICCDGNLKTPRALSLLNFSGTWVNSDGGDDGVPSNVTRICRAVNSVDSQGCPQIVYYQAGVGTGRGYVGNMLGGK